jgi:hypothetical protein
MQKANLTRRTVAHTIFALFVLILMACGGATFGTTEDWKVSSAATLAVPAGNTRNLRVTFENNNAGKSSSILVTVMGSTPAGWTVGVPATDVLIPATFAAKVEVNIPISVPPGFASGTQQLRFSALDKTGRQVIWNVDVTVSSATTGLTQLVAFGAIGTDSTTQATLSATSGELAPFGTLVDARGNNFNFNGARGVTNNDAMIWFSPKSGGISLEFGDEDQLFVHALPMTDATSRTFNLTSFFNTSDGVSVIEHSVNQSFSVAAATTMSYAITAMDWWMGTATSHGDITTTYEITLDPLVADQAGAMTFTVTGLPAEYSASVVPSATSTNAAGDPITLTVTITRISNGSFETTDSFVLTCDHATFGGFDKSIRLPIRTSVGLS